MSDVASIIADMVRAGVDPDLIGRTAAAFAERSRPPAPVYVRRLGLRNDEWQALRKQVFKRDKYRCVYCQKDVSGDPHCDHKEPLSRGGTTTLDNLNTACKGCNSRKKDMPFADWIALCQS